MAVIDFLNNFRIQDAVPIDTRFVVDNEAARFALPDGVVYEGLWSYQKDNDTLYVLTDISQANHADGWNSITSNSIEDFELNGTTGVLTITLEDGTTDTVTIPLINEGSVADGVITLTTQTGQNIVLTGNVTGPQGPQGNFRFTIYQNALTATPPTRPNATDYTLAEDLSTTNGIPSGWSLNPDSPGSGQSTFAITALVDPRNDDPDNDGIVSLVWSNTFVAGSTGPAGATGVSITGATVPTSGDDEGKLVLSRDQGQPNIVTRVIAGDTLGNFQVTAGQLTFDITEGDGTVAPQGPFAVSGISSGDAITIYSTSVLYEQDHIVANVDSNGILSIYQWGDGTAASNVPLTDVRWRKLLDTSEYQSNLGIDPADIREDSDGNISLNTDLVLEDNHAIDFEDSSNAVAASIGHSDSNDGLQIQAVATDENIFIIPNGTGKVYNSATANDNNELMDAGGLEIGATSVGHTDHSDNQQEALIELGYDGTVISQLPLNVETSDGDATETFLKRNSNGEVIFSLANLIQAGDLRPATSGAVHTAIANFSGNGLEVVSAFSEVTSPTNGQDVYLDTTDGTNQPGIYQYNTTDSEWVLVIGGRGVPFGNTLPLSNTGTIGELFRLMQADGNYQLGFYVRISNTGAIIDWRQLGEERGNGAFPLTNLYDGRTFYLEQHDTSGTNDDTPAWYVYRQAAAATGTIGTDYQSAIDADWYVSGESIEATRIYPTLGDTTAAVNPDTIEDVSHVEQFEVTPGIWTFDGVVYLYIGIAHDIDTTQDLWDNAPLEPGTTDTYRSGWETWDAFVARVEGGGGGVDVETSFPDSPTVGDHIFLDVSVSASDGTNQRARGIYTYVQPSSDPASRFWEPLTISTVGQLYNNARIGDVIYLENAEDNFNTNGNNFTIGFYRATANVGADNHTTWTIIGGGTGDTSAIEAEIDTIQAHDLEQDHAIQVNQSILEQLQHEYAGDYTYTDNAGAQTIFIDSKRNNQGTTGGADIISSVYNDQTDVLRWWVAPSVSDASIDEYQEAGTVIGLDLASFVEPIPFKVVGRSTASSGGVVVAKDIFLKLQQPDTYRSILTGRTSSNAAAQSGGTNYFINTANTNFAEARTDSRGIHLPSSISPQERSILDTAVTAATVANTGQFLTINTNDADFPSVTATPLTIPTTIVTNVEVGSHIGELTITTNSGSSTIGVDHIIFSDDTSDWNGQGIPDDSFGTDGQLALSNFASAAYIKRNGAWSSYIFPSTQMATTFGDLITTIDQALTGNSSETVMQAENSNQTIAIRNNGTGTVILRGVSDINTVQFNLTQYTSLLIGVGPSEITTTAAGYETDGLSYAHNGTTYYRLFASDGLTEILTTNQNNTDTGDIVYTKTY